VRWDRGLARLRPAPCAAFRVRRSDGWCRALCALQGLTWSNWGVPSYEIQMEQCPANGFINGATSGRNVGSNLYGAPAKVIAPQGAAFTPQQLQLTAAWNAGLRVQLHGGRGGGTAGTVEVDASPSGPTLVKFDQIAFKAIDVLTLTPSGGTFAVPGCPGGGLHFAVDDLVLTVHSAGGGGPGRPIDVTITSAPEPVVSGLVFGNV